MIDKKNYFKEFSGKRVKNLLLEAVKLCLDNYCAGGAGLAQNQFSITARCFCRVSAGKPRRAPHFSAAKWNWP